MSNCRSSLTTYPAVGEGKVLFNIIVKPRMFGIDIVRKDWFSPIEHSLSGNFSNNTVRDGMFGLGIAPKKILFCLFNPFNLKILDLHLKTWLWSPMICAEKNTSRGSGYIELRENIPFNNFVYF